MGFSEGTDTILNWTEHNTVLNLGPWSRFVKCMEYCFIHVRWVNGDGPAIKRRTRDRKVVGSSPGRTGGRIFFSRFNILCWFLFRYPFHPRVTKEARERSRSFWYKCNGQGTAKNTCSLRMWLGIKWHCKLMHGCRVCTERAPKRQQLHVAPAM